MLLMRRRGLWMSGSVRMGGENGKGGRGNEITGWFVFLFFAFSFSVLVAVFPFFVSFEVACLLGFVFAGIAMVPNDANVVNMVFV